MTLELSDRYVFHFDIDTGKSTGPKSSEHEGFGLDFVIGGWVVLN